MQFLVIPYISVGLNFIVSLSIEVGVVYVMIFFASSYIFFRQKCETASVKIKLQSYHIFYHLIGGKSEFKSVHIADPGKEVFLM